MKLNMLFIFILLVKVFGFVNAQFSDITYPAKNVETLVIFSFSAKVNDSNTQKIDSYIDYFTDLVNIWSVDKDIFDLSKIPLQLFFGNYNATELLNAADDENTTIAMIVLRNNQEFIDNVTIEANDTALNSKTACNDTRDLCNVINKFLNLPRDLLTKLNLVIFSNVCPDQSIFEEFHKNDAEFRRETFLVTTAVGDNNPQKCDINDKSILTEQFIPKDFNNADENYRDQLINPTFGYKNITNLENYLILFIKYENYDASLNFIADYYNDTTNCNYLEAPSKDERDKLYLITMRVTYEEGNWADITTIIPKINFNEAKFTFEEYLRYNIDYKLKKPVHSQTDINGYITSLNAAKYIIIFTDDYNNINKYDSNSFSEANRSIDYILYLTSPNDTIVKNVEEKFYRDDKSNSSFHILKPGSSGNGIGENICRRINKALPFELLWWHWLLIGLGILALLIGLSVFYYKCLRPKNLYQEILKTIPLEQREEFSRANDKLYIPEGKFKINFNDVIGRGMSSTVYEATISRLLLSSLTRKSFDNSVSEDCVVAAKLLNQFEVADQEQKSAADVVKGEIDAARMLERHDKICTLLGWSEHMGAPCLLFEFMEMDLLNYLRDLRLPLSSFESERGSTSTLSDQYIVPDFDERQQKIFLQILWQSSQGLEYISSKNIVHRDVAARNILISQYGDTNTFTAKIADFGLCVTVNDETKEYHRTSQNKSLPIKLFAPECHFEKVFSEATDVWAFGLLMIEVYSLSGPLYPGIKLDEIPEYLKNGGRMEKPEKMPDEMYDLAFGCWKEDPNLRKPFYKLSKELKEKLRSLDPENDAYRDYWHLQIEDEELMESFIPKKLKTK